MNREALFVYGTLHPNLAPASIRASVAQLRFVGTGTVVGELLDLGDYPGVITHRAQNTIPGTLFALPNDAETLHALDAYEGYDPSDVEHSLFVRQHILVTLDTGERAHHWIYLYNQLT